MHIEKRNTRYDAPAIDGWVHGSNSSKETAAEALAGYVGCWHGAELRAEPFRPDPYDAALERYSIKWAIYYKKA